MVELLRTYGIPFDLQRVGKRIEFYARFFDDSKKPLSEVRELNRDLSQKGFDPITLGLAIYLASQTLKGNTKIAGEIVENLKEKRLITGGTRILLVPQKEIYLQNGDITDIIGENGEFIGGLRELERAALDRCDNIKYSRFAHSYLNDNRENLLKLIMNGNFEEIDCQKIYFFPDFTKQKPYSALPGIGIGRDNTVQVNLKELDPEDKNNCVCGYREIKVV